MNLRLFVSLCAVVLSCWLGASYMRVNPVQGSSLAEEIPAEETPGVLTSDEVPMGRLPGDMVAKN